MGRRRALWGITTNPLTGKFHRPSTASGMQLFANTAESTRDQKIDRLAIGHRRRPLTCRQDRQGHGPDLALQLAVADDKDVIEQVGNHASVVGNDPYAVADLRR